MSIFELVRVLMSPDAGTETAGGGGGPITNAAIAPGAVATGGTQDGVVVAGDESNNTGGDAGQTDAGDGAGEIGDEADGNASDGAEQGQSAQPPSFRPWEVSLLRDAGFDAERTAQILAKPHGEATLREIIETETERAVTGRRRQGETQGQQSAPVQTPDAEVAALEAELTKALAVELKINEQSLKEALGEDAAAISGLAGHLGKLGPALSGAIGKTARMLSARIAEATQQSLSNISSNIVDSTLDGWKDAKFGSDDADLTAAQMAARRQVEIDAHGLLRAKADRGEIVTPRDIRIALNKARQLSSGSGPRVSPSGAPLATQQTKEHIVKMTKHTGAVPPKNAAPPKPAKGRDAAVAVLAEFRAKSGVKKK